MSSLITNPTHFYVSRKPLLHLIPPSIPLVLNFKNRVEIPRKPKASVLVKGRAFLVFVEVGWEKFQGNSWCCKCAERWGGAGDSELEGQILDFMENSSRKGKFPSKKELVEAGRLDIVEAIKKRGGWFLLGWGSEDEGDNVKDDKMSTVDSDIEDFHRRVESCKESCSSLSSSPTDSSRHISLTSQLSSSSGGSLRRENQLECESGVEGILSRLKRERNLSFGVNSGSSTEGQLSSSGNKDNHYTKPDLWKSWSLQRAGFSGMEFEAAEIPYNVYPKENGGPENEIAAVTDTSEVRHGWQVSNQSKIQSRLQDLEVELASALHTLMSPTEQSKTQEVLGSSSDDIEALSDALEFQENEYMSAQERLRSIHAKLTVLEGKMALAVMDTQKLLEHKQIRIDKASRTLQMLRTTCIVWHKSATEVFLAGSFDGWMAKRKMEKSRTGIFSVCLKLYPGKYEIKFIVDGIWKTDPLRPIVNNNGYENNVLIVA